MKRADTIIISNLPASDVTSTDESTAIINTLSDRSRTGVCNIFAHCDIMHRMLYVCDLQTVLKLRKLSKMMNFISKCYSEDNEFSPLGSKAVIKLKLALVIDYLQDPSKIPEEIKSLTENRKLLQIKTSPEHDDEYSCNKLIECLLDDKLKEKEALILQNVSNLDLSKLPITLQNLEQIKQFLEIVCKSNTLLPQLKALSLGRFEAGVELSLTQENFPCNITKLCLETIYQNSKITLSELLKLKELKIRDIAGTLIVQNLSNLVKIATRKRYTQIDLGSLILMNLPTFTVCKLNQDFCQNSYLSFENVPNMETLFLYGGLDSCPLF